MIPKVCRSLAVLTFRVTVIHDDLCFVNIDILLLFSEETFLKQNLIY